MSAYIEKPLTLIERKKQQWARERDELAGLSAPWGDNLRTRNVTKLATASSNIDIFLRRDSNASRRQSLPPIYKNQSQSFTSNEKEMGGETSGYGSDNPNNTPEYVQQTAWNHNLGYESSSSARDDRAKWGDRGVGVGKFWEPQDIRYDTQISNTPGWVKRGLQGDTDLVVSNISPAESPEQDFLENRPCTSSSVSQTRTYIRGQNNPVDPVELAERERRRQLALAHQEAIRQQLEERELKRREEKKQRIREEQEEEQRIERDQEIERQRREREQDLLKEKQDREKKRKQALEEAIQLAEKEALEQKIKHRLTRQNNLNINENVIEIEKIPSPRPFIEEEKKYKNINILKIEEETPKDLIENEKPNNIAFITNPTNTPSEKKENNVNRNRPLSPEQSNAITAPAAQAPPSARSNIQDNLMLLQSSLENYPAMPFAILMPTFNPGNVVTPLPLTVSVPVTTEETSRPRTENRVLTPTQYRNKKFCDSSTQTDLQVSLKENESKELKYIRDKFTNLEMNEEVKSRKDRSRTNERSREHSNDRPKWGANRPPTRYLKQSEKDPFYQRKKTRQKARQIKIYGEKNNNYSPHSSDESQIASPRAYRKKGYIEKRRTRALWQKNGQVYSRNVQVYQTEIVPLELDKDGLYYKKTDCIKCCCECRSEKHHYPEEFKVVDILKIEHTPRDEVQYKNSMNLSECNNSSVDKEVLEKLNSLQNGLLLKQEQWQSSPRTSSLCSPHIINDII